MTCLTAVIVNDVNLNDLYFVNFSVNHYSILLERSRSHAHSKLGFWLV